MKIEDKANRILDYEEHEFWKSSAPKVVVNIHKELLAYGLTDEQACNVIQAIWGTASEEYGN